MGEFLSHCSSTHILGLFEGSGKLCTHTHTVLCSPLPPSTPQGCLTVWCQVQAAAPGWAQGTQELCEAFELSLQMLLHRKSPDSAPVGASSPAHLLKSPLAL